MSMAVFFYFRKGFEQGLEDWSDFIRQGDKRGEERKNVGSIEDNGSHDNIFLTYFIISL